MSVWSFAWGGMALGGAIAFAIASPPVWATGLGLAIIGCILFAASRRRP